jgi:ribose transport system substrate-binding protein
MSNNKGFWILVALALVGSFLYNRQNLSNRETTTTPRIAFVVGGPDPFWQKAIDGAKQAAQDHPVELNVIVPEKGETDQTRQLLVLSPKDYEGIAISPLQPDKQGLTISQLASQALVVTYDNDAPNTLRHCHVGTNNYVAGRQCGELIKQALPEGGTIALFVGDHERENAQLRRQGIVDVLKDETRTPGLDLDPIEGKIEAGKFTIVKTYLDQSDPDQAKANATLALNEHPELSCMVALYGYNGPMCLKALAEADQLGQVKIVAFDDHQETLDGVEQGHVFATVVQDPFQYGYEAVRLLKHLSQNKPNVIPFAGRGVIYFPCLAIRKENLGELRGQLKPRESATEPEPKSAEPAQ